MSSEHRTEVNLTMPRKRKVELRERVAELLAYMPGKRTEDQLAHSLNASCSEIRRALGSLYGQGRVIVQPDPDNAPDGVIWRRAADVELQKR